MEGASVVESTSEKDLGTVLVTGATGFIAGDFRRRLLEIYHLTRILINYSSIGHVVQQLLLRGYKVRGTVRHLDR